VHFNCSTDAVKLIGWLVGWTSFRLQVRFGSLDQPLSCNTRSGRPPKPLTWRAAKVRRQHFLAISATLAHAKVDQTDVASCIQQDVVQLEISVYDVSVVQESDGANDLGGVKATARFAKLALVLDVKHQIASRAVLHNEEQVALVVVVVVMTEGVQQV
jgi:hypothetical protein